MLPPSSVAPPPHTRSRWRSLRLRLVLLTLAPLALAACGNDNPVGLDLVDTGEGVPGQTNLPARATTAVEENDFMAGIVDGDTSRVGARRALLGRVTDPVLGTVTSATGLVDFFAPAALSSSNLDSFRAEPVRSATLVLQRDRYTSGDSTATLRLVLRPVLAELPAVGGPVDTTYALGAPITTFAMAPADTTVRVELPAAWVAANDTTLRSRVFPNVFRGFALEADGATGNLVRGFTYTGTRLEAIAGDDTVRFAAGKLGTLLSRTGTPTAGTGRIVLQDGVPVGYDLTFRTDTLGVANQGLARAAVVADLDTTVLRTPGFRRGTPAVELIGVDASGNIVLAANGAARVRALGTLNRGRLVFTSAALTQHLQQVLLGQTQGVAAYRIRTLTAPATLDAFVIRTDAGFAPRFLLTLVDPS